MLGKRCRLPWKEAENPCPLHAAQPEAPEEDSSFLGGKQIVASYDLICFLQQ